MMGWNDERIDRVVGAGISDARMYKMAGNSIPVNILEALFKELFC